MTWLLNFLGVTAAHAANPALPFLTPVGTPSVRASGDITPLINTLTGRVVTLLLLIAGCLAVIYLIWCGIQYITAGGNSERAGNARKGIINAVIGVIIIMATYFIIRLATSIGAEVNDGLSGKASTSGTSSTTASSGTKSGGTTQTSTDGASGGDNQEEVSQSSAQSGTDGSDNGTTQGQVSQSSAQSGTDGSSTQTTQGQVSQSNQ